MTPRGPLPLKPIPLAKQWWIKAGAATPCRERVPLIATLSYPIPDRGELRFFHTVATRDGSARRIVSRLTTRLPGGQVVAFQTADDATLFPGLPPRVATESARYDAATEEALFRVYPLLVDRYPNRPAAALGQQFLEALHALVPPALLPYYEALNPDFFAWLRR